MIIIEFIIFQAFLFCALLDKNFDVYPIRKKNKKDDIVAPIPKKIF
tara:strand:- start:83 stop:220 length:138 start_codon:yes stop_codon:yes gene_type:complete